MPARGICEGDKVKIHVGDEDTSLMALAWEPNKGWIIWTVLRRPRDVGDTWALERDGQVIELNPNSANLDGLELVERKATDA